MSILRELKRRHVLRVAAAYLAGSWLLVQLVNNIFPLFGLSLAAGRPVVIVLAIGFVPALIGAWVFELTPQGLRKDDGHSDKAPNPRAVRRFDRGIIVALALAVVVFAIDRFVLVPAHDAELVSAAVQRAATDAGAVEGDQKSVAVLPFIDLSEKADQGWLADGLTEEILNSLAQLAELKVTSRTSSFEFRGQDRDITQIAQMLGVANVVEGSVRRLGNRLRVTAQLIRARDGFHLWSQNYERMSDDFLDVQTDVAERIAAALDIVLDDQRRDAMLRSGTRNVEAFEQAQRGWAIYRAVHAGLGKQTLWDANLLFERALEIDPGYAAAAFGAADAYSHLLLGGPVGPVANAPYSDEQALSRLLDLLDLAIKGSPNEATRTIAQLSRELYSPTWYRLPALIERLRDSRDLGNIYPELTVDLSHILEFTGNYQLMREIAQHFLVVDPLNPFSWGTLIEVEIYAGNLEKAADLIQQARRTIGDHSGFRSFEFSTLELAGGGPGSPERDATIAWLEANSPQNALLPALKGDYEKALQGAAMIEQRNPRNKLPIVLYCLAGDYDAARSFVRRIDASTAGPANLLHYAATRRNYIFQDFSATPNFMRQLRQAGIDPAAYPGDCPPSPGGH
jgi:adenylate cyclase